MCGIHLIYSRYKARPRPVNPYLQKMLTIAQHRGPDASQSLSRSMGKGNLHFGVNRLGIIDPHPRSNQPMHSGDGRYILCFNGTIYNYFELRNELLSKGVQFSTQSDTEVLLYYLVLKGTDALAKLNGMFTIFFYDTLREELVIARDRFGIKPLYYYQDSELLICSSEAKAIVNCGLVPKKLRSLAIQEYLSFKYVLPPATFFESVYQFPAGKYVTYNEKKTEIKPRSFVTEKQKVEVSEGKVLVNVEERLTNAVLKHLTGDANCALLLSGGVDSTLLLALIKEQGVHPVPTFSVLNSKEDAAYGTQDYRYATRAADMYGSQHYELMLEAKVLEAHTAPFIKSIDQPVGDSAAMLTYLLSAEVKKIGSVVLSGAGADELFGGYHRHQAFSWYLSNYTLVKRFSKLLQQGTRLLPVGFSHPLRHQFRLLRKLSKSLDPQPQTTYQNFIKRTNFDFSVSHLEKFNAPDSQNFEERWLEYALAHDLDNYLPQDVLSLSDNMSMAHSLEMRLPYLDLDFAEYAKQLPASLKLRHGKKWILKSMLEKRGGRIFCNRAKEGLGLPLGSWFRRVELHALRQHLNKHEHILYQHLPYERVQQLLRQHSAKKADHGIDLWNLWQLSAWLQHTFA